MFVVLLRAKVRARHLLQRSSCTQQKRKRRLVKRQSCRSWRKWRPREPTKYPARASTRPFMHVHQSVSLAFYHKKNFEFQKPATKNQRCILCRDVRLRTSVHETDAMRRVAPINTIGWCVVLCVEDALICGCSALGPVRSLSVRRSPWPPPLLAFPCHLAIAII